MSGTYLTTANVTAAMAIPFVGVNAFVGVNVQIDPQVYYDYADAQVELTARRLGVLPDSIALSSGELVDVNLKEWALCQLYVKLYSDKMLTVNQDDYTQDKYRVAIEECNKAAAGYYRMITADSIMGNVSSTVDATIRSFRMRRSS